MANSNGAEEEEKYQEVPRITNEEGREVDSELVNHLRALKVTISYENAWLLATARSVVETAGVDMDYNKALSQGKLSKEVFDNLLSTVPEFTAKRIKMRTRQLLFGISTEELANELSVDEILSMLIGNQ